MSLAYTYKWVCRTYKWVLRRIHMNKLCHKYEYVMCLTFNARVTSKKSLLVLWLLWCRRFIYKQSWQRYKTVCRVASYWHCRVVENTVMLRSKTSLVSPVPSQMMFDDGFIIRDSLDAQGVFARIAIKKNTMVHNDCFVWVVNDLNDKRSMKDKHTSYEAQWKDVCQRFSKRIPRLEQAIQELEPKRAVGQTVGAWLEAVLKKNGWDHFLMRDGADERVTMLAIYKGSKYNHSCAPTLRVSLRDTVKESDQKTPPETNQPGVRNEFWVTALEDIQQDGEVTVSYLRGDALKDNNFRKRRALLKRSWGFKCNCKKCESDIALEKGSR